MEKMMLKSKHRLILEYRYAINKTKFLCVGLNPCNLIVVVRLIGKKCGIIFDINEWTNFFISNRSTLHNYYFDKEHKNIYENNQLFVYEFHSCLIKDKRNLMISWMNNEFCFNKKIFICILKINTMLNRHINHLSSLNFNEYYLKIMRLAVLSNEKSFDFINKSINEDDESNDKANTLLNLAYMEMLFYYSNFVQQDLYAILFYNVNKTQ